MNGFAAATVTTDKNHYSLGETMIVTGTGFTAGAPVTITILRPDQHTDTLSPVVSGISGAITASYTPTPAVPGRYKITATDGVNIANTASTEADAMAIDFRQCSNNNNTLGACNWINGILQQNNSVIYEGMATLQRLIFDGIVTTAGNAHTLTFHMDTVKGGHHAYDFLTSWEAAIAATNQLHPPNFSLYPDLSTSLAGNAAACGPAIGPPGDLGATCIALRGGSNIATVAIPVMTDPDIGGGVASKVSAYELHYNNSVAMRLYGDQPISNATLAFNGYAPATGDQQAFYTLSWTSASTQLLIEFGAHVAVSEDNIGTGYGQGLGASFINGGPYHVSLDLLDGGSLGNQDNQLKGSDILIPPAPPNVTTDLRTASNSSIPLNSSVPAGTVVHDHVTVDSGSTLNPIPSGSTVTFHRFTTFDCSGSSVDQTVSLTSGSQTAQADSAGFTPATGSYSYNASFTSGNTNVVLNGTSTCEPFRVVDAKIVVSPLTATNEVNNQHQIIATVYQDDGIPAGAPGDGATGFGPAPDGTVVNFSLLNNTAGATFVNNINSCTTTGGTGTCSILILSSTAGGVDIKATTTFNVGGVSLTRTTGDGLSGDSSNAHKDYVDASIAIAPSATNEVGNQHIFTVTVTEIPGAATPATSAAITPTVTPAPSSISTTCGPSVPFSGNVATCTVTINSTTPGTFTANASATLTMGTASVTRSTSGNSGPGGSGAAVKKYVDANVSITPSATNEVGHPHTFTVTVNQMPNGATPAATANIVTTVTPAPSLLSTTCGAAVPFSGNVASCTVTINSNTVSTFTANASASMSIGGITLTRATGDGKSGDSGPAVKNYASGSIAITPNATNEVGQAHTFTITVTQVPGTATAAATANITTNVSPAPGTLSSTCGATVPFSGNTATCTLTINSTSIGTFTANATAVFTVGGVAITRTTDGTGANSGPAVKKYVDANIAIGPSATNEVGHQHVFTITVNQLPNGAAPATSVSIVPNVSPVPSSLNTTCGPSVAFTGNVATCTVTINNNAIGTFTANATATMVIGGLTVTRATGDGKSGDSGPAVKNYASGSITITPSGTNEVGQAHTFTINVTQAPGSATPATTANITTAVTPAPGSLSSTCGAAVPFSGNVATCTLTINNPSVAAFSATATATFSVGGVPITRTTDGTGANSGPAVKKYVDGSVSITPSGTNGVGQPHTFTITATQIPGTVTPVAATASISYSISPAPGTVSSTCGASIPFTGSTATCTVTINSLTPGTFVANAAATFTIGGVALTRSTSGKAGPGGSGPATKIYVAAILRIAKKTVPTGDPTVFTFTPTGWNAGAAFPLTDGGVYSSGSIAPGTYSAAEAVPNTFVLTNIACVLTGSATPHAFASITNGVSVLLAANEDVTCTFTNSRLPTLIVQKTIQGNSATFNFTIGGTPTDPPNPNISLTPSANSSVQSGSQIIQLGTYVINEVNLPLGWILTDKICTSNPASTAFSFTPSNTGGTFTAGYGDRILCSFLDNQQGGATRTQGFWATHTILTNAIWNGTPLPPDTSTIPATPVIGSPDAKLCTADDITAIATYPPNPGANEVLGGFWANIAKISTAKGKSGQRSDLDQARMQFLQQYLAAVLNVYAFGTPIPNTTLALARAAYCGSDPTAIKGQMSLLAAYNSMNDNTTFTPGVSATTQESKAEANIPFWDVTFR